MIHKIKIENKIFVEFGVARYTESNTRFLLTNNNWAGLVIDGSIENIEYIKRDPIYWMHNLKAECAFIDRDNINALIESNGVSGDIGLLSVDIDGNDYWVWEAIDAVNPRIVICEYNSLFGAQDSVSTPYDKNFYRRKAHYSDLYYGASIKALVFLANKKGYALVCGNNAGNNLFFVRKDLMENLEEKTCVEAYVKSNFRESKDELGGLTFMSMEERLRLLAELPVVDVITNESVLIKDLHTSK